MILLDAHLILKTAHVLGAAVLIGTGAGIAFFMLMAHLTGDARTVAAVARIVVIADYVFTASAAVVQPITGVLLARRAGLSVIDGWVGWSVVLYLLIGALWIPVVGMQTRMRDIAAAAALGNTPLPPSYHRLFRRWFWFGVPAFAAILVLLWLMVAKP